MCGGVGVAGGRTGGRKPRRNPGWQGLSGELLGHFLWKLQADRIRRLCYTLADIFFFLIFLLKRFGNKCS